jgi:transposase
MFFKSADSMKINTLCLKKVKREYLLHELRQQEPTTVVMEACTSSNHWGRKIEKHGHQVKLLPAFRSKPFVAANKNDNNDALAIAETALRPKMQVRSKKLLL